MIIDKTITFLVIVFLLQLIYMLRDHISKRINCIIKKLSRSRKQERIERLFVGNCK